MQEAETIVIYQSAGGDGRVPDHPFFAHDYAALLDQVERALARRQDSYPRLTLSGALTEAEAAADIAAWKALFEEWRWIVTGHGDLPDASTLPARIAAVDLAMERAGRSLAQGGRSDDLLRQIALLDAMRWHLAQLLHGAPAVHFWADLSRTCRLRAERWRQGLCPSCERRASDPATRACTRTDCGLPREADPAPQQKEAA